jgi:ribosome biogenesis GTPase A
MIVQIIGLPCTGKSTLINRYIHKRKNLNISYYDIANYEKISGMYTDIKQHLKSSNNAIVESATGLNIQTSKVLLYKKDISTIYKQYIKREGNLDEDYLSLLENQMFKPNYTVTNQQAMFAILDTLFY